MILENRISAFIKLGDKIKNLSADELDEISRRAKNENAWFTPENIQRAFEGIARLTEESQLHDVGG